MDIIIFSESQISYQIRNVFRPARPSLDRIRWAWHDVRLVLCEVRGRSSTSIESPRNIASYLYKYSGCFIYIYIISLVPRLEESSDRNNLCWAEVQLNTSQNIQSCCSCSTWPRWNSYDLNIAVDWFSMQIDMYIELK